MEFSYYGWLWIVLGSLFLPMEVIAYIVSIVKVVIDRYRIKKTRTARRQSRLSGVPSSKRLNIIIINDEERAAKLMSNGDCQPNHSESVTNASKSSTLVHTESFDHLQNGGHSVKVTVEYNVEIRNLSGDLAVLHQSCGANDITYKKITAAKRSVTIDGENVEGYTSFCETNARIGSVAGTLSADGGEISGQLVNSSSISLPDLSPNRPHKQPPPKPKRSHLTSSKRAPNFEVEISTSKIDTANIENENRTISNIFSNDGSQTVPPYNSDVKKISLSADDLYFSRRHSSTSATDTDCEVIHSSPNLSRSEDYLLSSSRDVRLTNISQHGHGSQHRCKTGRANAGFTDSSGEMKTNL